MAAPTVVSSVVTAFSTANSTTSGAINTTGATDLRIILHSEGANSPTISDSKGNSWSLEGSYIQVHTTYDTRLRVYKATGTLSVGTSHTFTVNQTGGNSTIGCIAVTGSGYTATSFSGNTDSSSPFTSPSVNPAASALLVAFFADDRAGAGTNDWSGSSFTQQAAIEDGTSAWLAALATRSVSAGTYSASVTVSGSAPSETAIGIISFTDTTPVGFAISYWRFG